MLFVFITALLNIFLEDAEKTQRMYSVLQTDFGVEIQKCNSKIISNQGSMIPFDTCVLNSSEAPFNSCLNLSAAWIPVATYVFVHV